MKPPSHWKHTRNDFRIQQGSGFRGPSCSPSCSRAPGWQGSEKVATFESLGFACSRRGLKPSTCAQKAKIERTSVFLPKPQGFKKPPHPENPIQGLHPLTRLQWAANRPRPTAGFVETSDGPNPAGGEGLAPRGRFFRRHPYPCSTAGSAFRDKRGCRALGCRRE